MKLSAIMRALCASVLLCAAGAAHASSSEEVRQALAAAASREIHPGDTPDQVAAFLKSHHFYASAYTRGRGIVGHSMFGQDGAFTADSMQAAYAASLKFRFDDKERLQDYQLEVQSVGR